MKDYKKRKPQFDFKHLQSPLKNFSSIGKINTLNSFENITKPLRSISNPINNIQSLISIVENEKYNIEYDICNILDLNCQFELLNDVLVVYGNQDKINRIDLTRNIYSNSVNQIVLKNLIFDFKENNYVINDIFKIFSKEIERKSDYLAHLKDKNKSITTKLNIKFEDCDFKYGGLSSIEDIDFNTKVEFINCTFNYHIVFKNCAFNNKFILDLNDDSGQRIHFIDAKFNFMPIFKNFDLYDYVIFDKCCFVCDVNFKSTNLFCCHSVDFKNSIFSENLLFGDNIDNILESKTRLQFKNSAFEKELVLKYAIFKKVINFIDINFNNSITIHCDIFKADMFFENSNFKKDLYLENSQLKSVVALVKPNHKITFFEFTNSLHFQQCSFLNDIEFYGADFKERIIFDGSVFKKFLKFLNCIFDKELEIKDCIFENNFIINNSVLTQGVDFSNTSFKGLISFYNSSFLKVPNFLSSVLEKVTNINLVDVEISQDSLNSSNIDEIKKYKENYRIFKDNLLKNNNNIEANKYKILELLAIEKELDYKVKAKIKIQAKEHFDRWFLKLNKITSDHHTDFLKIFLFTLSVIGVYFISNLYSKLFAYDNFLYIVPSFVFLVFFIGLFMVSRQVKNIAFSWYFMGVIGLCVVAYNPSIINPFLGVFSKDLRNYHLYKAIDELDGQKAIALAKNISISDKILSDLQARKLIKDYKDELKSSKILLKQIPELKRAIIVDTGVLRLNIIYYSILAFCVFSLQKTMRKNSIIPS